jgi:hypothetical protein
LIVFRDRITPLLAGHLDYCVNFELGRRNAFFVDAPLAWLLGHTSLDIEGRALRLPFPCFALVFTDRATLALAEVLVQDGAQEWLQIVTVYVIRAPAPRGMSALRLKLLLDAQTGDWPRLLERELRFAEDDDLDAILESAGEARVLVQLVVNAILYATSANVSWPIAPSPIRSLKSSALGRGNAKQARVAHRAQELGKQFSDEDVFFLPGRIPISQLPRCRRSRGGSRAPR